MTFNRASAGSPVALADYHRGSTPGIFRVCRAP